VGKTQNGPFQLSFNASLKVDFQGSRVTSDGGYEEHLTDSRRGQNTQFAFADLLRQSVYSRLAGYEYLNDAERLYQDPFFRLIGSEKIWDRGAALTSRLQTFETEMLAEGGELRGADTPQAGAAGQGGGNGFDRDPGVWGARAKRLQRALRVYLLPPSTVVQSRGGLFGGQAEAGQRAQRRGLGRAFAAGDRAAAGAGQGSGVPS
jgi:hypothetical protein